MVWVPPKTSTTLEPEANGNLPTPRPGPEPSSCPESCQSILYPPLGSPGLEKLSTRSMGSPRCL